MPTFIVAVRVSMLFIAVLLLLPLHGIVHADVPAPRVELDHQIMPAGAPQAVYVLCEFDLSGIKMDAGQPRPPVNLAVVLDRSGSMEARGKLDYAKKAGALIVDNLQKIDRLAVVEYDDHITVIWPSAPVESPEMIKRQIDSLTPRGSTNLTGGMMKGVDEVLGHLTAGQVNRVLLLTDGLANQGITHPVEIKRLVREARQKGVIISTLGLGLEYNEDLLQAIAESSTGHYYYIENPVQLTGIFQQELTSLFATVAQQVRVTFTPSDAVERVEFFGYQADAADGGSRVALEDLFAGEKRSLLMRIQLKPLAEGPAEVGQLTLSYVQTDGKEAKELRAPITVTASTDPVLVKDSYNKRVQVEAAMIEADRDYDSAVKLYEKGKKDEARKQLASLADRLQTLNTTAPDARLGKRAEGLRLDERAMADVQDAAGISSMLKQSKQQSYYAQRGKRGKYLLQPGDKGYDVEQLQRALQVAGLYQGPINGEYGPTVVEAVKELRRKQHQKVDGIAGPDCLRALKLY
jgi:Ca-activated chloride channel family protein